MPQSLAHLLIERAQKSGADVALRFKESKAPYRDMSWTDLAALVKDMAYGLVSLGLQADEKAAVMAPTSHHWVAADMSIITAGGVSVPIYPTSSSSDIEHILNNSKAKIVFVHNENLLKRVLSVKAKVPHLEKLVLLTAPSKGKSLSELGIDDGIVIGVEELLEKGRSCKEEQANVIEQRLEGLTREK
ncbi:MAG: AMP-binding protein, partial [Candidatus Obscuribacterales bacterium]|nr:AMP-binding protein [Candidatus Obscuribacterales bacterium]